MLASFLYSLDACCGFLHFGSLARDGKQKKIKKKRNSRGGRQADEWEEDERFSFLFV